MPPVGLWCQLDMSVCVSGKTGRKKMSENLVRESVKIGKIFVQKWLRLDCDCRFLFLYPLCTTPLYLSSDFCFLFLFFALRLSSSGGITPIACDIFQHHLAAFSPDPHSGTAARLDQYMDVRAASVRFSRLPFYPPIIIISLFFSFVFSHSQPPLRLFKIGNLIRPWFFNIANCVYHLFGFSFRSWRGRMWLILYL